MRVLVSGATGLVGSALARALAAEGHEPWGLARRPPTRAPFARGFAWDTLAQPLPEGALDGVDAVVHLAGENVGGARWSPQHKARIRDSRVLGTRALVDAIRKLPSRPRVLLCASAVGIYGDRGDAWLDEDAPPGASFLAEVCVAWERESAAAAELGVRVVQHRIGIVLARQGGALEKMLPPFRLGVGGPLGDGRQFFPWIHLDDVVGALRLALENDGARGPLNTVAPEPLTNADFTRALGKALHRPAVLRVPRFALKLAVGEMADALLESQRPRAERLKSLGYAFRFPEIDAALKDVVA